MIKVFQISSEVNVGSVGRIAEQIGESVLKEGWESHIAYGREAIESKSKIFRIGSQLDVYKHVLLTRLTDKHGYGSKKVTLALIEKIKKINPDIIQLQHVHGYYINIELLFNYLKEADKPVVWTFHDCWSFTGHCAHYELVGCEKWKTLCEKCPQLGHYPNSLGVDNSKNNYINKRKLFTSVKRMVIVPVSNWLNGEVKKSFLKEFEIKTIHNGIDINQFVYRESEFRKRNNIENKFILLGVASPWSPSKGLNYFLELSKILNEEFKIVLVGLNKKQIQDLPSNIIGFERTKDVNELAELYSSADVFVNPTLEDTFPSTNLEAQACGTPVVTFKTGGSPEALSPLTGIVVDKGNVHELVSAIQEIKKNTRAHYSENCRKRIVELFDKKNAFKHYISIYKELLKERGYSISEKS